MKLKSIPVAKNAVYGNETEFSLPLNISIDNFIEKAKVLTDALFFHYATIGDGGQIKATFDERS